ncbi:MAG: thymidylate synthase [Neptuniibacter sp.]
MFNGTVYKGESGYLRMVNDILHLGVDVPDRTGVGSRAMFDAKVVYSPREFPFSTVRPAALRMAFEEFWMMMNGRTQTKELEEKGIFFWQGNTSREFLDKRGLDYLDEGDMGQAYGWQWRSFNRQIAPGNVVDQLKETFEGLKNDTYGRRHLTTFWNPAASRFMALTPCWYSHQFVVLPHPETGSPVLHMKVNNRSLDTVFGFQFAAQQYRLYQMCMAKALGFDLGWMSCDLTQIHIYQNQFEYAEEMVERKLGVPGKIELPELNSLDDILNLTWDDIIVTGLEVNKEPFIAERPPMAV